MPTYKIVESFTTDFVIILDAENEQDAREKFEAGDGYIEDSFESVPEIVSVTEV